MSNYIKHSIVEGETKEYHDQRDDETSDIIIEKFVSNYIKPKTENKVEDEILDTDLYDFSNEDEKEEGNNLCTDLKNLQINDDEHSTIIDSNTDIDRLVNILYDGDELTKTKSEALDIIYALDQNIALENINKLRTMCLFEFNKILANTLCDIVLLSRIPNDLKYQCALSLYEEKFEYTFKCFEHLAIYATDLTYFIRVSIFEVLFSSENSVHLLAKFKELITDDNYPAETRYKTLHDFSKKPEILKIYVSESFSYFFTTEKSVQYRILAAQYILQNRCCSEECIAEIENQCVLLSTNTNLDYHLRADVSDLLIRLGNENSKEKGLQVIGKLGRMTKDLNTFYNNSENVHDEILDESISKSVLQLGSIELLNNTNYDEVANEIRTLTLNTKYENDIEKLNGSLLRISLDSTIYPANQCLVTIFLKVWQIIKTNYVELELRLVEELIDMYNTCTSGHVSRLINVFSGTDFLNVGVNIGFRNQIIANVNARLNKRIKDITDLELQETILNEMTTGEHKSRYNFAKFFSDNIIEIRNELYSEFVDNNHVTHDEFELYFRESCSLYDSSD